MARFFCGLWDALFTGKKDPVVFEISRRTEIVSSTAKAADFFRRIWDKELLGEQEQVYIILLDYKFRPKAWHCIHTGGVCETIIDFRVIMGHVLKHKPSKIFIAHNHPSGALKASDVDIELTTKLATLCDLIQVEFLDHIIITEDHYLSFREKGLM